MLQIKEHDWLAMQPVMFTEQKKIEAPQEAEKVIRLLDLPKGAAILDLPCGIGRHTVELAKRGYTLAGVDIVQEFLDQGKKCAMDAGVSVEWQTGDMRMFRHDKRFDAVINMYTSFGYFREDGENREVAATFFSNLKPGGKLLIDVMSREIFTSKFPKQSTQQQADGSTLVFNYEIAADSWLMNTWSLTKSGTTQQYSRSMKLYNRDELVQLLTEVGFREFKIVGDLDGSAYSSETEHLVIVCERPR